MIELVISCTQDEAETLSDLALELGAVSVSLEDEDRDTADEQALFGEPGTEPEVLAWGRNLAVIMLPEDETSDSFIEQLKQEMPVLADRQIATREVEDQDWVRLTQSQFDPIQIGERIWIVPSWHQSHPGVLQADKSSNIMIELDPGLAFGTGSHPTTRLCAEWIESQMPADCTVLDYGCGSGILAIIAARLNAGSVIGVDIDEQAVEAARFNAQNNHVQCDFCLPDELSAGQYNVVVANILSSPLKLLAPMLCERVAPGGHLVLSGILERQAEELIKVYSEWMDLTVWQSLQGWGCLAGQKS